MKVGGWNVTVLTGPARRIATAPLPVIYAIICWYIDRSHLIIKITAIKRARFFVNTVNTASVTISNCSNLVVLWRPQVYSLAKWQKTTFYRGVGIFSSLLKIFLIRFIASYSYRIFSRIFNVRHFKLIKRLKIVNGTPSHSCGVLPYGITQC